MAKPLHYKRVKHYHEPGDLHELTFSCYHRMKLLTNDAWRERLARSIDEAMIAYRCHLIAFVFMPEHVHLLVRPLEDKPDIPGLLTAIKQPYSAEIRDLLEATGSSLLERLTIQERPGKLVFRYWQEGPGYDRNLQTPEAILASMEYTHMNPVRRKLCQNAIDWKWSSARQLLTNAPLHPDLPRIHPLPAECFDRLAARHR